MMNASLKGKYDTEKSCTVGNGAVNAGDVKLRATVTDGTSFEGFYPSFSNFSLSVGKPGSFLIDYNVPKKDFLFQFMDSVTVLDKPLHLTYTHARGENLVAMDGTLVVDPANKLSGSYEFNSGNSKVKYSYMHRGGTTTFEPCYDFAKNSWDFAVSQKVYDEDIVRASYQTSSRVLGLEWSRNSMSTGVFKMFASINLNEKKMPKLSAESIWNFEM